MGAGVVGLTLVLLTPVLQNLPSATLGAVVMVAVSRLIDVHGLGWDEAWEQVRRSMSYTNHTLLPEALETWPQNGPPRDPASWLIMVARNTALDSLRRRSKQTELPDEEALPAADVDMVERLDTAHYRDDVLRLMASVARDRPVDKRDRAILMLLIVYGLRAGEIRGLQLDDLDWENGMLRVRCPKPGRTYLWPLSHEVGYAILLYIREARPSGFGRSLFFTAHAPIRPLGRTTLGKMVRDRLAGIGIATATGSSRTSRPKPASRRRATSSRRRAMPPRRSGGSSRSRRSR